MKSKASYFSISKPFMIENLRRFWAIPVLAFLVYFLSGVFPLLMTYSHLNDMTRYIVMSLNNQQPFYLFAHLLFPIVTAVVVFRYLQGVSSVSVMHSMPFTRSKLYNTGFLSGLILIITPIVANGLILLAISKPTYNQYSTSEGITIDAINLFSRADILNWIWISILIVIIVYAISVFAGIVSGNTLMHFSMAIFFNFIIPGLYAVFIAYFSRFLYGFDTNGNWFEICMKITPFLNAIANGKQFGTAATLYYIASFLVLYLLSGFLYRKRALEHATDSLAFNFMEPIICYLIAFLGMTLLGFYFDILGESNLYIYAGLTAGTIIFFIFGQMIVKKTPRIFNRSSLKSFIIYGLIAVLFIASLVLDLTGFEKRVPNPQDVTGFTINDELALNYSINHFNNVKEEPFILKDPKNIEAATALHQSIIANMDQLQADEMQDSWTNRLRLNYNPKSAFPINRSYVINYDFLKNSKEAKQIFESKEFKEYNSLKNLNYESFENISLNSIKPMANTVEITDAKEMQEFINCLDKDFRNQTFEDMVSLKHSYAVANINYTYKNKLSNKPNELLSNSFSYEITWNYTNTIQWLKDHNFADQLELKLSEIESIEIAHFTADHADNDTGQSYQYDKELSLGSQKTLKITDPDKIQAMMEIGESMNTSYSDYYYGIIYLKGNGQFQENWKDGYSSEEYAQAAKDAPNTIQFYLNEGNVPDYVLKYFAK